MVLKQKNRLKF